jgi:cbb3-type cytochrome oxidase subunit 1
LLLIAALGVGGATQGRLLNQESVAFLDITKALLPWFTAQSVAFMVLLVGHAALAVNFFLLLKQEISAADAKPATFTVPPALAMPAASGEGHR